MVVFYCAPSFSAVLCFEAVSKAPAFHMQSLFTWEKLTGHVILYVARLPKLFVLELIARRGKREIYNI